MLEVLRMGAWEDGFAAGYRKGLLDQGGYPTSSKRGQEIERATARRRAREAPKRKKRTATAAQKRYGKAFKRLAPKYKKKSGGWKKDGFKRCAAAARREAKR
jgi:hypothetical protein